jgi:hypothetical protein
MAKKETNLDKRPPPKNITYGFDGKTLKIR